MKESTRLNITRADIWTRGLYMLLFVLAYNLAEAAIVLTAIFQFFCALITGTVNEPLLQFSKNATCVQWCTRAGKRRASGTRRPALRPTRAGGLGVGPGHMASNEQMASVLLGETGRVSRLAAT